MHEVPLDMTTACALSTASGNIIGWYQNEKEAATVARDMASRGTSCFLLSPTRSFTVATPPVREAKVQRKAK